MFESQLNGNVDPTGPEKTDSQEKAEEKSEGKEDLKQTGFVDHLTQLQKQNLIENSQKLFEEVYGKNSRMSIGHQHKQILFMVVECFDQNLKAFSMSFKFSGNDLKIISRQLIGGLLSAHKQLVCHRDLKPQNLLVNK